ncbi:Os09g0240850, partial [Oryza sativa Japonica Group]
TVFLNRSVQCLFHFPPPTRDSRKNSGVLSTSSASLPLTAVNLRRLPPSSSSLTRGGASLASCSPSSTGDGEDGAARSCSRRLRNVRSGGEAACELLRRRTPADEDRELLRPSTLTQQCFTHHCFPPSIRLLTPPALRRYFASLPSIPAGTPHTPFYSD